MTETAIQTTETTKLTERQKFAARITKAASGTVTAILDVGRLLCEAKAKLKHGDFTAMVENDLPFTARTVQRLMAITHDQRLANPTHASLLPPSWTTLYELSQLHDDEFERGIEKGIIRPDMKRSDVKHLHVVPGHLAEKAPAAGTTLPAGSVTVTLPSEDTTLEDQIVQAVSIIKETHRASTSALQRRLRIGYTRAAKLMDALEERGFIGPPNGSEGREVKLEKIEAAEGMDSEQEQEARPDEPDPAATAVHVLNRLREDMREAHSRLGIILNDMLNQVRRIQTVYDGAEGVKFKAHIERAIEHRNMMEVGGLYIEAEHYKDAAWQVINK